MRKEYNGQFWTMTADEGNVLWNTSAGFGATIICTADENATGWTEINESDIPDPPEDDIPAEEALDIITGVSE